MKTNQTIAIANVRGDEGGWNPHDPSNNGITLDRFQVYCTFVKKPKPTIFDLQHMTEDDKQGFYRWMCDRIDFDNLAVGVDYAALDAVINEGEAGCVALLVLTKVLTPNPKAHIQAMSDIRLAVKRLRPEWAVNGPGWTNRIGIHVPQRAFAMLGGVSG